MVNVEEQVGDGWQEGWVKTAVAPPGSPSVERSTVPGLPLTVATVTIVEIEPP